MSMVKKNEVNYYYNDVQGENVKLKLAVASSSFG